MNDNDLCATCGHKRLSHNRDRGMCNANITGPHFCHCRRFKSDRRRRVRCANGNTVERFYDARTRSSVTIVLDAERNQIGEASYDGNAASAAFSMKHAIAENGGER